MRTEFKRWQDAYASAEFELRERFKATFIKAAGDELLHIDGMYSAARISSWTGEGKIIWCFYCGEKPGSQREHKTPLSRGGSNDLSNIVRSCRKCNLKKG
jgi:hypothetical protein